MNHWEEKYQANTIPWDRGGPSPALRRWLDSGALAHERILVPGCGRGHEVLDLASQGYQVTGLDLAPTALKYLRGELDTAGLEAELVCADALTWHPTAPYDAIYEQTCLCALAPELWRFYAYQLLTWLKPGGQLYALFMQTDRAGGPPYHCGLEAMREIFPETLWQWPEEVPETIGHPIGHYELAMVLIKR